MQLQRNPGSSAVDGAIRGATRSRARPVAPDQGGVHDLPRHYHPADPGTLRRGWQGSGRGLEQSGRGRKDWGLNSAGQGEVVPMMFSYRLVRLIESHADALAKGLEERVEGNPQVAHFRD